MRPLPVPDPGTPDLRSARRFLLWLMTRQPANVLLGVLWGCSWMIAQALVPAALGAAVDALAVRDTTAFTSDCPALLGLGVATPVPATLRPRRVVGRFLHPAYRGFP